MKPDFSFELIESRIGLDYMNRPNNYKTKQRDAVLEYIASLGDNHVTAAQIVEHFMNFNISVGRTTIYRQLDKLVESGKVRKYTTDGVTGSCFQYIGGDINCREHFHLKCEVCGQLRHLTCDTMNEAQKHINDEHSFQINNSKTVLYGVCGNCI